MRRADAPSLRQSLRALALELSSGGVESAEAEAERLIAAVLGVERSHLAFQAEDPLPAEAITRLNELVRRRLSGTPLQHLEGSTQFRDLDLVADSRALIPRPETEQLVSLIHRTLNAGFAAESAVRVVRRPGTALVDRALDIGTGSGAIALSLAAEGIARRVLGLDSSAAALEQAEENRRRAGSADSVEFRLVEADPFDALHPEERFQVLVSNPPYVTDAEFEDLPRDVRGFEPEMALRGGPDGLDLIRLIARRGADCLVDRGRLFLEIGESQPEAVLELLAGAGNWENLRVEQDLAGRSRFVVARRG